MRCWTELQLDALGRRIINMWIATQLEALTGRSPGVERGTCSTACATLCGPFRHTRTSALYTRRIGMDKHAVW
eukprot:5485351-Pleurochrysis_carterae.AAC.3